MTSEQPRSVRPRPRRTPAEETPETPPPTNGSAPPLLITQTPEFKSYTSSLEDVAAARKALQGRWGGLYPATDEWIRQMNAAVHVEPLGLGYRASAHEAVSLELSRLRDARGELSAELSVRRWGQHVYQARFNLSSGTARAATARLLAQHPFGGQFAAGEAPDWREVLEQLSVQVLERERAGEAFERVGQAAQQPTPPRIIEPYLPAGPTLIWAPQGVGKSTLAAGIVVSLETYSEVVPGWHPTTEARCLILDWEASPGEWNDRIARISAGIGHEPPSVLYRRPRRPLADMVESVASIVDSERVGFLVIDSTEKASGASVQGEGYDAKAERLFLAIDRIGIPALLLDHVTGDELRHGTGKVSPKSIGSVLKGAWARATYDLKRDPETSTESAVQMLLTNVKVNTARRERPYVFAMVYEGDEHTGPIRFKRSALDSPQLIAALPQADQMWRLLATDGSHTVKAIAEALETTQATVRTIVLRDSRRERPRFVRLPDNSIGVRQSDEEA